MTLEGGKVEKYCRTWPGKLERTKRRVHLGQEKMNVWEK